jgi:hypothetical protein
VRRFEAEVAGEFIGAKTGRDADVRVVECDVIGAEKRGERGE